MKRFRILSIILFGAIIFSTFQSTISSFLEGFHIGYQLGTYEYENGYTSTTYTTIHTTLKQNAQVGPESVNTITGDSLVVIPRNSTIINFMPKDKIQESSLAKTAYDISMILLNAIMLGLGVLIFVLYLKISCAFGRSEVFKHKIIRQISIIGYSYLAIGAIGSIILLSETFMARQLIGLQNLNISYSHCIAWDELVIGLIILVMNEIVKVAKTMKDEQELTI